MPGPRNPWLTPYMVDYSTALHAGGMYRGRRYKRAVMVTAAQSGKSDSMLDVIGARLDQRPAPILYVGPSADFNRDQFEPRLTALFEQSDSLRRKLGTGRMKKTLKRVAGVPIRLAHAGSSTALKSDPAQLALVDEYDEMMANVRGQGDVLGLVEARGETYADFVTGVTSTCSRGLVVAEDDEASGLRFWATTSVEDLQSPIWALWQEGTRHHFAWPCRQCEAYFIPSFETLRWPSGSTPARARAEAWVECPHCGGVHTDADKDWLNARGVHVAPGETVALVDDAPVITGAPAETSTLSFWTSGLCSPFVTFGDRAERYLGALASGDQNRIQTAMNAAFGQCYAISGGGDVPEWEEVRATRCLPYERGEIPDGAIRLIMGVDVQKWSIYYVTRAFGARGTSWLIDWGQLHGPTALDQVWDDLREVMTAPIGGMAVSRVMIDSGFRPDKKDSADEHKVYEFVRRHRWLVQACKGRSQDNYRQPYTVSRPEVDKGGKKQKGARSVDLTWLSSDWFKSLVMSRLNTEVGQPGAFYLPQDVDEDYCRQLVSEERMVIEGRAKWVKRFRDNHFLDCEALAAAGAFSLNIHQIPERPTPETTEARRAATISPARPDGDGAAKSAPPPPPDKAMQSRRRRMGWKAYG